MSFLNFESYPLLVNLILFGIAAAVVWFAGSRASYLGDSLSDRTNLGRAFVGYLLLAIATDAPEIGTTVTAAIGNNPELATNNMFGGIIFQTAILVVLDLLFVRGALTYLTDNPVLQIQGSFLVLLLGVLLIPIVTGFYLSVFGISAWTVILILLYLATAYLLHTSEKDLPWEARHAPDDEEVSASVRLKDDQPRGRYEGWSLQRIILFFAGAVILILASGMVLARTGEAIATATGLGSSFIGATLVATSTSLPELSTAITAVRIRNFDMAIANIFGSNTGMFVSLFLADVFYREGSMLEAADTSAHFNIVMGIVLTAVYIAGLMERREGTIFRMGYDSAIVLVLYVVGLFALYQLR